MRCLSGCDVVCNSKPIKNELGVFSHFVIHKNILNVNLVIAMNITFGVKLKLLLLIISIFYVTIHIYTAYGLEESRELASIQTLPCVVTSSWPIESVENRSRTVAPNNVSWAFATVLTASRLEAQESQGVDRDYISMVCILGSQLQRHYPSIERIIIVQADTVTVAELKKISESGWTVLIRPHILPRFFKTNGIFVNVWRFWRMGMYKDQFLKLHLWTETRFNRIVFIDADTMVMRHVDFSASLRSTRLVSCPVKWTTLRSSANGQNSFTSFNGAMFVLTPSVMLYEQMMENNVVPDHFKLTGRSGGVDFDLNEMGTLNHFFPDWIVPPEEFHGICSGVWLCCTGVEIKCPTGEPVRTYTDTMGLVHEAKSSHHLLNYAPGGEKQWKSARDCLAPLARVRTMEHQMFLSGNQTKYACY